MSSIQMPVPIVFWGQRPPSHDITCISSSDEKKGFATGSRSGQICLWDITKDRTSEKLKVRPRCLLFGESSAIISLCFVKNWSDDRDHIASLDQDGTISLWDGKDGACLKYAKVPGKHRGIKCLLRARYQECLIACYGCYSSIIILHPYTLETLCTLKSGHNPNWIEQICFLGNVDRKDALLGITVNGMAKLWLMPGRADMRDVSEVFEETSKKVGTSKPLGVGSWFKGSAAAVLVVFSDVWQIYDASGGKMKLLLTQQCVPGCEWAGGDYLSERTVVVWTAGDMKAYVYTLTPRCVPGMIETFEEVLEVSVNTATTGCTLHFTLGGVATPRQATFLDRHWFVQGDSMGRVYLWDIVSLQKHTPTTTDPVPPAATNSVAQSWLPPALPCGLTDTVYPPGAKPPVVTCTLYVASLGRLVCGQQDGCIVVMSAIQAATVALLRPQKFSRGWPQHCFLSEHHGKVTCLLHPYDYSVAYDNTYLVSGGADFTVRLWNLFSGTLVHTFAVHGGEVQSIICCPPGINPRLQTCVCSISKDYSVAILSTSERRCLLVAACHSAPVTTVRWRLEDDFLLVGCMDGKLFVWQIETGTLDRCVHGEDAQLILTNTPPFNPTLAWPDYPLQILGFGAGDGDSMIQVMLFDPPNLINRLNNLDSMVEAPPQKEADAFRTYHYARRHFGVQNPSPRRGSQGSIVPQLPVKPEPTPYSRGQERAREVLGQAVASQVKPEIQDTPQQYINITRLVVSCLHAWGLDQDLDKACESVLGLVRPNRPISFGLLGQGERISLVLPGWGVKQLNQNDQKDKSKSAINPPTSTPAILDVVRSSPLPTVSVREVDTPTPEGSTESSMISTVKSGDSTVKSGDSIGKSGDSIGKSGDSKESAADAVDSSTSGSTHLAKDSSDSIKGGRLSPIRSGISPVPPKRNPSGLDQQYHVRWQLSSSLTTQHLLTVVSITNTLMNKTVGAHALSVTARKSVVGSGATSSGSDESGEEEDCELVSDNAIRAAWSQLAALHCVMLPERMEGKFRPPHLPVLASHFLDPCPAIREASQALLQSELRRIKAEGRRTLVSTWASKLQPQSSSVLTLKRQVKAAEEGVSPSPAHEVTVVSGLIHQQTTALIILGMVGAEFGSPAHSKTRGDVEPMDPVVARQTAKALQSVILEKPANKANLCSILRCSAVELMGRGFQLWEKYVDVAEVLVGLLDLAIQDMSSSGGHGEEGTSRKTAVSTQTQFAAEIARRALNLMVTLSPVTTILTLAKEVSLFLGSQHVTHYPHSSLPPPQGGANPLPSTAGIVTPASSLLPMAAGEMMEIMRTAVERSTQHIGVQLLEVVDIVLFCVEHYVDSEQLKRKSLLDIFPPFARIQGLSYSHKTRRLAAGGRNGQVCIYDLKHKRSLSFSAHQHPVSTLQFSEDGRQLATFSYGDSTVCVWQISSNLLGTLQTPKCSNSWPAAASRASGTGAAAATITIQWTSHKSIILKISGAEFKFFT